ncbi:MAG: S53 family peptidase [Acidimicrobiales bacterium]|jgi:kumamolisin
MIAATGVLAAPAVAVASHSAHNSVVRSFSVLPGSLARTTDVSIGAFHANSMSVELALAPSHEAQLQSLLASMYSSKSSTYQHWLKKGEFDSRFAPSAAEVSAVTAYLKASGLVLEKSSSPFLVRAKASSARISTAFRTKLLRYRDPQGITYFSNASTLKLPTRLVDGVLGIIGLSNTVRERSMVARIDNVMRPVYGKSGPSPSCETSYPTAAQLFNAVNNGVLFPYGYGGGPGCNGLTPSQTNSIYDAPNGGPRVQGAGVNLAVFELSAYQASDIDTWAQTFYGRHYTPPLVNVTVDGGPLSPVCPTGDTCPANFNGYAGDIEVDADIEMQLSIAPDAGHILVYNAPNDYTGQTELDEYTQIAKDDTADVVSSSWSVCENDAGTALARAENVVFEQMAAQGQSMFGAEGDTGAFSCIRSDGTTIVNVLDPPAQPWVTSVGGTSLESYNPGANPNAYYPNGVETVWNVDNLCNNSTSDGPSEGGQSGFFWCGATGAGGGGSSQFWGRPRYQFGPGVNNPNTTYANGTTHCALASIGTPCREVPDISANADEYTPYAEYCTGNATTPFSVCATISGNPSGWFGIGGTSLSSPLWSGIIADRDGFVGHRTGNANPLLYQLFNTAPQLYFHDITGFHQSTNNNGLFPTTPGYDEATGIGTPRMDALITDSGFSG